MQEFVFSVSSTMQEYQYTNSQCDLLLFLPFLALTRFLLALLVIATLCFFFGCSAFSLSLVSALSESMAS